MRRDRNWPGYRHVLCLGAAVAVPVLLAVLPGCATASKPAATGAIPTADANVQRGESVSELEKAAQTPGMTVGPASTDTVEATAGAVRRITLNEAIRIALDSNVDLALSRSEHEVLEARAAAAKHVFLPTLGVGAGFAQTDGLVQGSFGDFRDVDSRSTTAGLNLALSTNIGARIYESRAAQRQLDAALLETLSAQQRLTLNVIELYEDLVLAKVGADISRELVQSSEEFMRIADSRYRGGIGLGSDVSRAQANVASSLQQLEQLENTGKNTSARLAVVLRLDPVILLEPADTELAPWQLPSSLDFDVLAENAASRPDIEAARMAAGASELRLQARWWDLVAPDLSVEWRLSGIGGEGDTTGPETARAASNAAGSIGRSVSSWQGAADAVATQSNLLPALSSAAGSAGRAAYAYSDLLGSTHQEYDSLERQERFGIGLSWSLSFTKIDRIREQRAEAASARLRVAKSEDAAVGEVRQAQNDIQSSLTLRTLVLDEMQAATDNHRVSLARYKAGTAIAFEVLDAQDTLAEARLKQAQYTAAMNIAQARLLTAAGVITESFPEQLQSIDPAAEVSARR